jgi:hypothetical protein
MSSNLGGVLRVLSRLVVAVGVIGLTASSAPALAGTTPASSPQAGTSTPVFGVQDSVINLCDGSENRTTTPLYGLAASSMTDAHWAPLHVGTARFSPPWDIAYHHDADPTGKANAALEVEQLCLDYWLTVTAAHGVQPEIAFKPDANYLNTYRGPKKDQHILVPSIVTYRAAMDAFTAIYSNCTANGGTPTTCNLPPVPAGFPHTGGMARVRIISSWGEPNFSGSSPIGFAQLPQVFSMPKGSGTFHDANCRAPMTADTCGPVLAAQMWLAVADLCTGCTVVAGDFSSAPIGETQPYLDRYARSLHDRRPQVWGIHPYTDISTIEDFYGHVRRTKPRLVDTLVGQFAAALRALGYRNHTQIWLNEISTFYLHGLSDQLHKSWTRPVQAKAGRYLLDDLTRAGGRTTAGEPVVTRTYYLRYADGVKFPRWALVVGGFPQPVYTVFANRPNPR